MKTYTEQLEANLTELVSILKHKSLWNFLSDKEKEQVGKIVQSNQEAKESLLACS